MQKTLISRTTEGMMELFERIQIDTIKLKNDQCTTTNNQLFNNKITFPKTLHIQETPEQVVFPAKK